MQARITMLKDVFGLLREVIIVVALGMFLVLPGWVNSILNAAGFTRGSIGGFEWEGEIVASAETTAQTGVEMEALTAASVAALTVYDMAKAIDKGMVISEVTLVEKTKEPM